MNSRTGLIICALLGALDVIGIVGIWQHPATPAAVAIGGAVLGAATLAALRAAGSGNVRAVQAVIGTRVASALLGLPVFFVDDAPGWARIVVAISIAATVAAVAMLMSAARPVSARRA